jgi:Glycosyltransferases involved in cell wall biogenesis
MSALVSIIIPVYNGEKYILRCLNSIEQQTYENIEVIILNDGSIDNTDTIVIDYARGQEKIRYYYHENVGVGNTRNKGIDLANGEFITFVDADDTIEREYVSTLVHKINNQNVVISGYQRLKNDNQVLFEVIPKQDLWSEFKFTATCGKLYRRSYINEKSIRYQDFAIGEDICFSMQAFSQTKKVVVISYAGYQAHYNESSVTKMMNATDNRNKIVPVLDYIENSLDFKKYSRKVVLYFYTKTVVHHLINQHRILPTDMFNKEYEESVRWLRNVHRKYNKKIRLHYEKADSLSVNIGVLLFVLFEKSGNGTLLFTILKKLKYERNS